MFDLIVKNAKIVDGTGTPWYYGDVAVKDGKIAAVGKHITGAARIIDAHSLTVAPGFIDPHSHGDMIFDRDRTSFFKLEQGITTEVTGSCGLSPAPVSKEFMADCLRSAGIGEHEFSLPDRLFFSGFMRSMDLNYGTNVLPQVGHGMVRAAVCGYAPRELSRREMQKLCGYIDEAMQAGASGISFGLIYPPGSYAPESELTEACKVVAKRGGVFTIHMRNEGSKLVESVEETIRVAEHSGCRAVISHHKASGKANHGKTERTLELIDKANARGVEVFLDQYPYTASSTGLNTVIPDKMFALGEQKLVDMLTSAEGRAEMREIIARDRGVAPGADITPSLAHIMVASSASHKDVGGRMLNEAAQQRGVEPVELLMDILRDDRLNTGAIYFTMSEDDVERVMVNPRTMVGTDGLYSRKDGGVSHPRAFGTFPRFLGRYVRERGLLSLEEGIRKVTSMPAAVFNLQSKGLIRVGMDADLVVFSPEKIIDNADYAKSAKNSGIKAVILAGHIVVEDNEWNGGMFGKMLRR